MKSSIDCRRNLSCSHQPGGWEFHDFGDPYPFEDVERYKTRPIRKGNGDILLLRGNGDVLLLTYEIIPYGPREMTGNWQDLASRFRPALRSVAFFKISLSDLAQANAAWSEWRNQPLTSEQVDTTLSDALERLPPLNGGPDILCATKSEWCVIISGRGDTISTMSYLSKSMRCTVVWVNHTDDTYNSRTGEGQPGSTAWCVKEGATMQSTNEKVSGTNFGEEKRRKPRRTEEKGGKKGTFHF